MKTPEFIENEVKELGPGVFLRVAIDNIAWCDLGFGVIIDALEDPEQADVVRELLKETTGQDLRFVVNTHWDTDHIACNPQWKQEGAVVIAHETCAQSAGDWPEGRPDVSFGKNGFLQDTAVLRGEGQKRIEMTFAGGTHTPWDTILYFPHAKVLHIADLFGWGLIPCQPTPEKIALLRPILQHIQTYDAHAVICGHGPDCTLEHLKRFGEYLEMMLEKVPPLSDKSVEEIEKLVPPPVDMEDWWRFTAWKHKKNIELIQSFYTGC